MKIKHLHSGGLITNYACPSRCAHCLYSSGPRREKGYATFEQVSANLRKIRSLGCRSVHIGGGEPFLNFNGLKDVLRAAASESVAVEYIETNSSWVSDDDSAVSRLEEIMRLGVSTLLVSISPFHNEYIPFRKVERLISICRRTGMNVFPWLECFIDEIASLNKDSTHTLDEYESRFGPGYVAALPRRHGLNLRGRALSTFRNFAREYPASEIADACPGGCANLEDTSHFHIDFGGGYIPGLCTGFLIESTDLGGEIPQDKYPILNLLHSRGISAFLRFAQDEFGFSPKGGFVSKCDLCQQIRKFIVAARPGLFGELAPAGFYSGD